MRKPKTLASFLRRPNHKSWLDQLDDGWPGPDGSSMSTDTIMGVRIGITSPCYKHVDLPANRHDWMYRLARRYRLPDEWRKYADMRYRDMCWVCCKAGLRGWKRALLPAAWARCHARYIGLRAGAKFAWTKKAKLRKEAWQGTA